MMLGVLRIIYAPAADKSSMPDKLT